MSKFDELLSSALQAGATHVYGISFRSTELKKYREQARSLAVKAALEKATLMARDVGQKVGKAASITEVHPSMYGVFPRTRSPMAQMSVQASEGQNFSAQESLAPGQIAVKARVSISVLLE